MENAILKGMLWGKGTKYFLETLETIEKDLLLTIYKNNKSFDINSLSLEEIQRFDSATHCEICHTKFANRTANQPLLPRRAIKYRVCMIAYPHIGFLISKSCTE